MRGIRDRGKTVVLTTHSMEEAERLCDRVAIIDHGRIVEIDSPEALVARHFPAGRIAISDTKTLPPTLEDVFLKLTGDAMRD